MGTHEGRIQCSQPLPGRAYHGQLRPRFNSKMCCSKDIPRVEDGAEVITAGLVIRRQRPQGKVVFITLEDEFGHIPLMVFPRYMTAMNINSSRPS